MLFMIFFINLSPAHPAQMSDYCITPPFIVGGVSPNLLMMIDNSASMFDLTYIDRGKFTGTCSVSGSCSDTVNCPAGQTCTNITFQRNPLYCFDRTYKFGDRYAGYFSDWYHYYEYDFVDDYFVEVSAPVWTTCDKYINGSLCINGTNLNNSSTPKTITKFVAEGNYLNWLTASKFDVQKQILTGGKYIEKICATSTDWNTRSCNTDADCPTGDTCISVTDKYLMLETRGCVGKRFIKEPITQQSYIEGGTNTPLGLTFAVKGPDHPYSQTLLSPGGQAFLEIYAGDYQEGDCQNAVDAIVSGAHKNVITGYLEDCLNYSSQGQAKYCSLDFNTQCSSDADCTGTPGTCQVLSDGVCGSANDGICSISTAGICTADNGTCSASKVCIGGSNAGAACNNNNKCNSKVCSKICQSGGKAGSACNVNADCNYSSCEDGKIGSLCVANADCDLKNCSAGLVGNACVANADCNTKECTAGLVGNACTVNTDCNSAIGTCTAGNIGASCSLDIECGLDYKGVCQKPVTSQIKTTFTQSVHECTQFWDTGHLVGNNWLPMVTNPQGCNQMYKDLFTCRGGSRDAKLCETDADCPSGECINGPQAIRQGSPVLICGPGYAGHCASSTCSGGANNGVACSVPSDCPGGKCWESTIWNAREYASVDLCVQTKFEEYCGAANEPPVTDPTDDPSSTENFDNLPAIIGDMAVGSQLGDPLRFGGCTSNCALRVSLKADTAPAGLLQEFEGQIRFGAMKFNFFGSSAECPTNVPCTKICNTSLTTCVYNADCPSGEACVDASNVDGGRVIHHIEGRCSVTTSTSCVNDAQCPADERCLYPVGSHTTGLIKTINNIQAATWTPFAEGFYNAIGYFANERSGDSFGQYLRLNADDFDVTKPPSQYRCQKNNVLLITDGMSTADLNPDVNSVVSAAASYQAGATQINTSPSACPKYAGSRNLDDLTWLAKNRNIKDFTEEPAVTDPSINRKTITTYVVYNGVPSNDPGECNPDELLSKAAGKGCGTDPALGCYQRAENPAALQAALRRAFLQISGAAASGTAASVLATGEGSGANLIQALFYPEVTIGGTLVNWTGSMKNMWYFIDPRLGNSSIREDTLNDGILNLNNDNIVHFFFDPTDNLTKANLFADTDGDGVADSSTPSSTVYFENVKSIWEAGAKLWAKNPADRLIYTTTDGSTRVPLVAPLANDSPLIALLQAGTNRPLAERIINYTRGTDYNSKFCSSTVGTACTQDSDCPSGETCIQYRNRTVTIGGVSNTLKLGDIINSTPRVSSWVPLNTYHTIYKDLTYRQFTESSSYTDRGTVFVGANDGMLHAFKLGKLELFNERFKKAQLTGTDLGNEQWAFIPKNVLPYLKYMAETSYCHLYYVDATPYIFDASFNTPTGCSGDYWDCTKTAESWRTVLIGSMRLGGACKDPADSDSSGVADSCTKDINNDGVIDNRDCVLTPASGTGYSSYFALDVTDPAGPPQVLWEFAHPDLGFSTSGPAVVRLGDKTKNGRWFVVLGSGPTGPIDTATQQMMGYSDQNLKVFILDLQGPSSGAWTLNTDYWVKDSGIANAFSGSMINAPIDFDQRKSGDNSYYQDDAVYFGYVKAADDPPTVWNVGGVLRLLTKNDLDNPANWALSRVMPTSATNIGPVPSAVVKLQNYNTGDLYLFFGTGRYYFKAGDQIDDANIGRSLYGIKDPCFSSGVLDVDCTDDVARSALGDANSGGVEDDDGWYIDLDLCTDENGAAIDCASASAIYKTERNVTDPLATRLGAVFFTTTKPSADVCSFGGASHLWAVNYKTGGAVSSSILRGKALMQVSTGSIEEVDFKTAFTGEGSRGGRKTAIAVKGQASEGASGIFVPGELKKILHIRER